jgi:ethanolamine utilization protein EutA
MTQEPQSESRVFYANPKRHLSIEPKTSFKSLGIDIGSSTSHLVISEIQMEQKNNRFLVADINVFYESDILLTPYSAGNTIDANALKGFIDDQIRSSGVSREDIETGAIILTGLALLKTNSRKVADIFSANTGKFISVSAGDRLEATLAAYGSGALVNSRITGATVMNIDIGGGTTKITICMDGEIVDLTTINIGSRLLTWDTNFRITSIEVNAREIAGEQGFYPLIGEQVLAQELKNFSDCLAEILLETICLQPLSERARLLHRIDPLKCHYHIDAVTFSGGVSEFIYGYSNAPCQDLGPYLAEAMRQKVENTDLRIMEPVESIRATVIGASQYSAQISGLTVYIDPETVLPLRNIPVIKPILDLGKRKIDSTSIAQKIKERLTFFELDNSVEPVAICFDWEGSAAFDRIDDFLKGVFKVMSSPFSGTQPLILVCSGDLGRVFGRHARDELNFEHPIISIDGIELKEFDFIDFGSPLPNSAAIPVIVKSLMFPSG